MKIISRTLLPLFLAVTLVACNSRSTPTSNPLDVAKIALAIAETGMAMTQTAIPTTTSTPQLPTLIPPTPIPPEPTRIPLSSYEDKIDYALATAPKISNRLPYIGETSPYGEYNRSVYTNDLSNVVYYGISHSLNAVTSAFEKYFQQEKWGFTEATTELVGYENNVPQVSYDVYRILPNEPSALEHLQITLRDESSFRGKDYIDVRIALKHIETKSSFRYFGDIDCGGFNNRWLGISLVK